MWISLLYLIATISYGCDLQVNQCIIFDACKFYVNSDVAGNSNLFIGNKSIVSFNWDKGEVELVSEFGKTSMNNRISSVFLAYDIYQNGLRDNDSNNSEKNYISDQIDAKKRNYSLSISVSLEKNRQIKIGVGALDWFFMYYEGNITFKSLNDEDYILNAIQIKKYVAYIIFDKEIENVSFKKVKIIYYSGVITDCFVQRKTIINRTEEKTKISYDDEIVNMTSLLSDSCWLRGVGLKWGWKIIYDVLQEDCYSIYLLAEYDKQYSFNLLSEYFINNVFSESINFVSDTLLLGISAHFCSN